MSMGGIIIIHDIPIFEIQMHVSITFIKIMNVFKLV